MNGQLNTGDKKSRFDKKRLRKFVISGTIYCLIMGAVYLLTASHSREMAVSFILFNLYVWGPLATLAALWFFWRPYNKEGRSTKDSERPVVPKDRTGVFQKTVALILALLMAVLPIHIQAMSSEQVIIEKAGNTQTEADPPSVSTAESLFLTASLPGYDKYQEYQFRPFPKKDNETDFVIYCLAFASLAFLAYSVYRCADAAGLNNAPPPPAPPPPPPPTNSPPTNPPAQSSQSSEEGVLEDSSDWLTLPPLQVYDDNTNLCGIAAFYAGGLNELYGRTDYVDPDGYPYVFCRHFVLQSATALSGPWTNKLEVYVWQNSFYTCATSYSDSGELIENVVVNGPPTTNSSPIMLESFAKEFKVKPGVSSRFLRLNAGQPLYP